MPLDPRTLPASELPARNITIRAGKRDFYRTQFAQYGLNFDLLPNYPDELVNPRSQVASIGAEREIGKGLFVGADYVHQHWTDLDRTVDLNAPSVFDRTAPGQVRTVAAANVTRPIVPVNGGVRSVNVLMNLGVADYDGLQTQFSYRGNAKIFAAVSYTLSKATNTTEPDGNGIGPNESNIATLGETERGPSLLDQRHRAVITFTYLLPYDITVGTVTQLASARPFNATTGVDNNGDGANNDRPVINGAVIGKSTFRGTATQDVSMFVEGRIKVGGALAPAAARGVQPVQPREHARARADDLRRHRRRRTRRSASSSPRARRPTRSRRSPTSIRRGCSSSRCGSRSRGNGGDGGNGITREERRRTTEKKQDSSLFSPPFLRFSVLIRFLRTLRPPLRARAD